MAETPRRDERLDGVLNKLERWGDLAELRERTVSAAPSVAGLRDLAALYERHLSDTARALSTYERVLQIEPHEEAALQSVTSLAEARGDLRRAGLAQRVLGQRTAAAGDGGSSSHGGAEGFLLRAADLYFRASAVEDAEATLLEARALGSQEAETRLLTSYESRKHWHGVAELLEQRLGRLEGDAKVDTERRLARLYLETLQDTAAAVPYLERLVATSPDLPTLGQLASAYEANGSLGLACDTLGKMIRTHAGRRSKELGALHHRLGRLCSQQGDHAQALAEFDTAFKMDPGNVLTLRDLGHAAFVANDLDRAQKTFRALLLQKLEPGGPIGKGEVFFQLGRIAEAQSDKAKAIQMYERALENRGEALSGDAAGRLAALKG
jgi:tetratricopeptide (TPR) repeat protein